MCPRRARPRALPASPPLPRPFPLGAARPASCAARCGVGAAAWHAAAARSKCARVASVSRREQRLAREGSINANYQL